MVVPMFGVIFDFDGTILDSETAEYESHRRCCAEYGVELSEDEWCTGIGIVQPDTHWFDWLCARAASPPSLERFHETTRAYFRAHVSMQPMPGIAELIDVLASAGVPRAVGSTASSRWVLTALDDLRLTGRFTAIVTGDQVERGKPAPDVYLEAARRLGLDPRHCVAIEDSGPGVAAAKAAGMKTVAIPHPLSRRHDLSGADLYAASASELSLDRLRALVGPRRS